MTTATTKRRNYTKDFKWDAVAQVVGQGYKTTDAACCLGIEDNPIRCWMREFEEAASCTRLSGDEREELKQLRKNPPAGASALRLL
jgi:transposase-like protein